MKHIDFIVLDIIVLQICFILSYWIWVGLENPYDTYLYRYQAVLLAFCQLLVALLLPTATRISSGGTRWKSLWRPSGSASFMRGLPFLFMVHHQMMYLISRMSTGIMCVLYLFGSFFVRLLNKKRIFNSAKIRGAPVPYAGHLFDTGRRGREEPAGQQFS